MAEKKNILAIIGSASENSANLKLVELIGDLTKDLINLSVYKKLKSLPHFDPELSANNPPEKIIELRNKIDQADGVIICTPEYVFSIPAGLKNAIEWCIATTVFTDKPCGLITASAHGQKGHEELQLIMKTAMAKFNNNTTLLIQGIKGRFDQQGNLINNEIINDLEKFMDAFKRLTNHNPNSQH